MMDDPLAGRFLPGSRREKLWQTLWMVRTNVVPLSDLYALLGSREHPQQALSNHVTHIRGQLSRTRSRWALTNRRGVGYVVEARAR